MGWSMVAMTLGAAMAAAAPVGPQVPDSLVDDAARLAALGREFPFGSAAFRFGAAHLRALHEGSAGWRDAVQEVTLAVAAAQRADRRAGVGMRYSHRLFDVGWLRSPHAHMDLVGAALRLDRAPFMPGHCGELRLVYRLSYHTTQRRVAVASRLPMTVNVVRLLDGDCAAWARARRPDGTPGAFDAWAKLPDHAVELNVQTVRWPSTVRPDLGGHAEYALRVLHPTATGLAAAPMENQPDVERLLREPAQLAAFRRWLREPSTGAAIDQGTALLPQALWATAATSHAPRGLVRSANRPFQQLAAAADVTALGGGSAELGRDRLRRLDQHSCTGCHQSRGIAGFHLPGSSARVDGLAVGRLAAGASAHLMADLPRRAAWLTALLSGQTPVAARPPAEAPANSGHAGHGEHCGLRAERSWKCATGLACTQVDDPEVGTCLPTAAAIGDPCERGLVQASGVAGGERVASATTLSCGAGYCESSRIGFPAGLCAAPCSVAGGDQTVCGGIPGLVPFNACLARGEPFDACAAAALRPARLHRCDERAPCRDDYACMAASPTVSVCMPPYFLQELRVDGHPRAP